MLSLCGPPTHAPHFNFEWLVSGLASTPGPALTTATFRCQQQCCKILASLFRVRSVVTPRRHIFLSSGGTVFREETDVGSSKTLFFSAMVERGVFRGRE